MPSSSRHIVLLVVVAVVIAAAVSSMAFVTPRGKALDSHLRGASDITLSQQITLERPAPLGTENVAVLPASSALFVGAVLGALAVAGGMRKRAQEKRVTMHFFRRLLSRRKQVPAEEAAEEVMMDATAFEKVIVAAQMDTEAALIATQTSANVSEQMLAEQLLAAAAAITTTPNTINTPEVSKEAVDLEEAAAVMADTSASAVASPVPAVPESTALPAVSEAEQAVEPVWEIAAAMAQSVPEALAMPVAAAATACETLGAFEEVVAVKEDLAVEDRDSHIVAIEEAQAVLSATRTGEEVEEVREVQEVMAIEELEAAQAVDAVAAVPSASPPVQEEQFAVTAVFTIGDRVRSKTDNREGTCVGVDSDGDPKVMYDGDSFKEARQQFAQHFEVIEAVRRSEVEDDTDVSFQVFDATALFDVKKDGESDVSQFFLALTDRIEAAWKVQAKQLERQLLKTTA